MNFCATHVTIVASTIVTTTIATTVTVPQSLVTTTGAIGATGAFITIAIIVTQPL